MSSASVTFEGSDLLDDLPDVLTDQSVPADLQQDVVDEIQAALGVL